MELVLFPRRWRLRCWPHVERKSDVELHAVFSDITAAVIPPAFDLGAALHVIGKTQSVELLAKRNIVLLFDVGNRLAIDPNNDGMGVVVHLAGSADSVFFCDAKSEVSPVCHR